MQLNIGFTREDNGNEQSSLAISGFLSKGTTGTSFGIATNPAQMLEAKAVTGRDERGRRGADRNLGLATLREHIPPPRQELPRAKEQLLHKCPEL